MHSRQKYIDAFSQLETIEMDIAMRAVMLLIDADTTPNRAFIDDIDIMDNEEYLSSIIVICLKSTERKSMETICNPIVEAIVEHTTQFATPSETIEAESQPVTQVPIQPSFVRAESVVSEPLHTEKRLPQISPIPEQGNQIVSFVHPLDVYPIMAPSPITPNSLRKEHIEFVSMSPPIQQEPKKRVKRITPPPPPPSNPPKKRLAPRDPMKSKKRIKKSNPKLAIVEDDIQLKIELTLRLRSFDKTKIQNQNQAQVGYNLATELTDLTTVTDEFISKCRSFEDQVGIVEFLHHVVWGGIFIKTLEFEWTQSTAVAFVQKHGLVSRKFANMTNSVLCYWLFVESKGTLWFSPQHDSEDTNPEIGYSLGVVRKIYEAKKSRPFILELTQTKE